MQKLLRFATLFTLAFVLAACSSSTAKKDNCGCNEGAECNCASGECNCHGDDQASKADPCLGQPLLSELAFSPEFKQPILKGQKQATTRLGVRCFVEGQKIRMTDPTKKVVWGQLTVKNVTHTSYDALTPEVAAREGTSLESLRKGLLGIYGEKVRTEPLTVVDFAPAAR
jgi:uncharacterized protein YqfB (UPF0267 family)